MTNPVQPLDPAGPPGPLTPAAAPSDPAGYASVTPHGPGPAPYDIQAPDVTGEMTAAFDGATALAGAGALYPMGPRQAQTERLLSSPQGFNSGGGTTGWDITAGYSGSSDDPLGGWPNNPQPSILETPVQGQPNSYPPSTGTD